MTFYGRAPKLFVFDSFKRNLKYKKIISRSVTVHLITLEYAMYVGSDLYRYRFIHINSTVNNIIINNMLIK